MNAEEYNKLAKEAHDALKENGYDIRVEITTVTHPVFKKNQNKYGVIYTVLLGSVGMASFYEEAMRSHEKRAITATWIKEHGVKAKVITYTPEGYTKLAAKEWEKQLQSSGVELDEDTANFVYAVSLYEDPILRYQDAKDMFDDLAEAYFGENLENSIALVKEAMKHLGKECSYG